MILIYTLNRKTYPSKVKNHNFFFGKNGKEREKRFNQGLLEVKRIIFKNPHNPLKWLLWSSLWAFITCKCQSTFLTTTMHVIVLVLLFFFFKLHIFDLSSSIHETLKFGLFARIRPEIPVTAVKLHKRTLLLLLNLLQHIQCCSRQRGWFCVEMAGKGLGVHQQTCPSAKNDCSRPAMSGLHRENNLFPIIS